MSKTKEDLGIKVGTKEEKFWTDMLDKCKEEILNNEREIIINRQIILLANQMISDEKKKI